MEKVLGWRSQHDRLERWRARIAREEAKPVVADEDEQDAALLDLYLAFFVNCYALADWLVNSGAAAEADMRRRIEAHTGMSLCRDICNRSKHFILKHRPSVDAEFSILREYRGRDCPNELLVLAGPRCVSLRELAGECAAFWREFAP
jgi:hypothetical protein